MKQVFVVLGSLLAATSALLFFAGRAVNRRQAEAGKVSAAEAAARLQEAWADHRTRA